MTTISVDRLQAVSPVVWTGVCGGPGWLEELEEGGGGAGGEWRERRVLSGD